MEELCPEETWPWFPEEWILGTEDLHRGGRECDGGRHACGHG